MTKPIDPRHPAIDLLNGVGHHVLDLLHGPLPPRGRGTIEDPIVSVGPLMDCIAVIEDAQLAAQALALCLQNHPGAADLERRLRKDLQTLRDVVPHVFNRRWELELWPERRGQIEPYLSRVAEQAQATVDRIMASFHELRREAVVLPPPATRGPDENGHGQEHATEASPSATTAATLPTLGPRDREAWQASLVAGMTQVKIAEVLNRKYAGEHWAQPRVSEAIKRAKAHAEASGLAGKVSVARSRAPARTLDPAAADRGERTDGRVKRFRDKARQIAKET